jgi:hypothetical protein
MKALNRFANEFLHCLLRKNNVVGEYNIKVLFCTESFWNHLHTVHKKSRVGNPHEYIDRLRTKTLSNWQKVNAWNMQVMEEDDSSGEINFKPTIEQKKDTYLGLGFAPEFAEDYREFDALIFLNHRNIEAGRRRGVYSGEFVLTAHEVYHIAERLSLRKIAMSPRGSTEPDAPEVASALEEFLRTTTWRDFFGTATVDMSKL